MTRTQVGSVAVIAVLAVIQLVPVSRENPEPRGAPPAPDEVLSVLRESCFDCHSHETRWPWYAYVAPSSWLVAADVSDAREDLNFSRWDEMDLEDRIDRIEEIGVEIEEGHMPPRQYWLLHPDARLDRDERQRIAAWVARVLEMLEGELDRRPEH